MAVLSSIWVNWDVSPRVIWVTAPIDNILVQDILDTCRSLEAEQSNITNAALVSASGKGSLGYGVYEGISITLLNTVIAFEDRPGPDFTQCVVSGGNIIAFDSVGNNLLPIQTTAYTQVVVLASIATTIMSSSGNSTDPWSTDLTMYGPGTAGNVIQSLPSNIWNEPTISHLTYGTVGFVLTQLQADTSTISISQIAITSLINTLLKYERNRTKIDTAAATLTIFDNDGVTPLTVFALSDHLGNPSISEICERNPN